MFKRHLFVLCWLYLLLHVLNLTVIPIFGDEAIYIDWGWREVHQGVPYHSLYDGKQPFLMWIYGILQTIPVDPLWICRFFSVLTGLAALLGIYLIAKQLFDKKIAFLSALFYSVTPLFLFFNRQALMESSLAAASVWSLYFLLKLLDRPRAIFAIASGIVLGLGFFIKSTALVFVAEFIFIYFLFLFIRRRDTIRHFNLFILFVCSLLLVNFPLFFQPKFWSTLPLSVRYSLSLSELFKFPFHLWFSNFFNSLDISFFHLSPFIFLPAIAGTHILIRRKKFIILTLLLWIFLPLLHTVFFARSVNFRYLLPYLPLITIPAAIAVYPHKILKYLVLGSSALICLLQIFNPPSYFYLLSRFTRNSAIESYITGDFTGYPVQKTVLYLNSLAKDHPIVVGIALNIGNPESALLAYLRNNPNITVTYIDSQMFGEQINQIDCFSSPVPFYFVARQQQQANLNKYFSPVSTITYEYGPDYITIYTLKSDCSGKILPLNFTRR